MNELLCIVWFLWSELLMWGVRNVCDGLIKFCGYKWMLVDVVWGMMYDVKVFYYYRKFEIIEWWDFVRIYLVVYDVGRESC